ncbi:hypothetical protein HLK66_15795 [Niallia circulans]|uniref:hypothetical protein n=1 Tax=Niallia circulans TaxID=1397 RepID=UPI00148F969E|nr:hypothetical protein [Niallia circulans]QJX62973.1 hypothetical protein HLK66_15795 [Niallia circulans]
MFKLKITTHSGAEYVAEVDEYTPSTINEQLNKNEINTVAFGDIIVSRIDVKSVVPVEVPSSEEPIVDEPPIEEETPVEPTEE